VQHAPPKDDEKGVKPERMPELQGTFQTGALPTCLSISNR